MSKVKFGAHPYIYPMPTVLIGTIIDNKPSFITVSYIGIVQHKPPMLSVTLIKSHFTNKGIVENKTFSVNIPNTRMLKVVDYIGMNSGERVDKSLLFDVFYGDLKTAPLIKEVPLNLECELVDIVDLNNNNSIYIGKVVESYTEKKYLKKGRLNLKRLNPILFSISSNSYYNVGRRIGWAWKAGLFYKPK